MTLDHRMRFYATEHQLTARHLHKAMCAHLEDGNHQEAVRLQHKAALYARLARGYMGITKGDINSGEPL